MLVRTLCLLLTLFTLIACSAEAPAATRQEQVVDGFTIGLEAVDKARINTAQEFVVTLNDASGQPIEGASVYLDLEMTAMPMGSNQPVASDEGQGRYRAQTAYDMTGSWSITVVAEINGASHQAVFNREVVN